MLRELGELDGPGFDPRLRDGGDPEEDEPAEPDEVSIHASVMEATMTSLHFVRNPRFRSTPP